MDVYVHGWEVAAYGRGGHVRTLTGMSVMVVAILMDG
jgi:hypothetical protein